MAKSLLATFPSSDTFSQQFSGEIAAKFLAVLEAVSELSRPAKRINYNTWRNYLATPNSNKLHSRSAKL
jgi:hypothetical protein